VVITGLGVVAPNGVGLDVYPPIKMGFLGYGKIRFRTIAFSCVKSQETTEFLRIIIAVYVRTKEL
jgi:hypothetical protein